MVISLSRVFVQHAGSSEFDFQYHRKLSVMVYAFNPGTGEVEAEGSELGSLLGVGIQQVLMKPHLRNFKETVK